MKKLLFNARIVSPGIDIPQGAVSIEAGRVLAVHEGEGIPAGFEGGEAVDLQGALLLPGFIDIHSHGADGCDVCDDSLDSLRHIARRKLQEGVTTWLPTTLTQPSAKLRSIAATIAAFAAEGGLTRCPGMHVEGPFINRDKAGAQNPEFVRPPDLAEFQELNEIFPALILSLAPEMPGALELIAAAKEGGTRCSAAHTAATAAQIFAACDAGLTHLTHYGNAMTPLHHREIGVIGAGMLDDRLRVELIADGIHLSPDMLRLICKVIPLERLMLITDSVAASWIEEGEVSLGGLPVVVKDGVARLRDGGALAGSTLKANEGLRNLVRFTGLPLADLVRTTSWNQAGSLGLEGFGKIEAGYHADLVVLDDDFNVLQTYTGGEKR